jgi:hypothetical protein
MDPRIHYLLAVAPTVLLLTIMVIRIALITAVVFADRGAIRIGRLTIGSSGSRDASSVKPRRESMIGIKCLRLTLVKPYVAQPHR